MTLISFIIFLGGFLLIGLASMFRARNTPKDYYLAGGSVSPAVVGLSAVATNNSGYMFIGAIGYTYVVGLASVWLMLGWICGDLIASLYVHSKLRTATARTGEASYGSVLSLWSGVDMPVWRRLAALITIVFLGTYAAAQIAAGGKALNGVLGWPQTTGAWIAAGMVLAYSFAGGIRASIWTDVAQSLVMLVAMTLLFVAGVDALGGVAATLALWRAIPGYFDLVPPDMLLPGVAGVFVFILGWMFAGISVIGQPHIMVRFMALDRPANMMTARAWYYGFFTVFYALAIGVGMLARLLLPDLGGMDPELALPTMAVTLLPPVLVGVILAGIFAATMSTADSLVLSCSAAITRDLPAKPLRSRLQMKTATATVTGFALFIALDGNQSVFDLVILSWSTLAVAFGPLLILYAMRQTVTEKTAIAMMVIGIVVALGWRMADLHNAVYEGLPGMMAGVVTGLVLSHYRRLKKATT